MQLFYSALVQETDRNFTFDAIESRHIVKVLRKKEGDQIYLTNGRGILFHSALMEANPKRCTVRIERLEKKQKQRPYYLHMAISPTKNNDRFEWFLEKATEIGVDEISPIFCDHSERKTIKMDRLKKIIETAGKQSLKFHFPKLNPAIHFSDFIAAAPSYQKYIAHCNEDIERKALNQIFKKESNLLIAIGPEGDFSLREIQAAISAEFSSISLGSSRLRTETAGLVAVHSTAILYAI